MSKIPMKLFFFSPRVLCWVQHLLSLHVSLPGVFVLASHTIHLSPFYFSVKSKLVNYIIVYW